MGKLFSTIRLCAVMFMARTFGEYQHSGWNGDCEFALYLWRGKYVVIPTAFEDAEGMP